MQVKSGTYAGDGVDPHAIAGVGFQPHMVIIKGGANRAVIATDTMGANNTKPMTGALALFAGGVKSLDADGFTLGNDARVNAAATTYFYLAIRDNGAGDFKTLTYNGDGADNRNITTAGFQPDMVITCSATTQNPAWRTSDMAGDNSQDFGSALIADKIQSLLANGFQVGTHAQVNANLVAFHAVAIRNTANLFKVLTYNGNATDNRNIPGVGFQPDDVLIKSNDGATAAMRFKDQVGDSSFLIDLNGAAADRIQALQADGFQVGLSAAVNTNLVAYYSANFKDGTSSPPAVTAPGVGIGESLMV